MPAHARLHTLPGWQDSAEYPPAVLKGGHNALDVRTRVLNFTALADDRQVMSKNRFSNRRSQALECRILWKMKNLRRFPLLILLLVTLVTAACMNPASADHVQPSDLPAEAQNFVSLMNDHRESQGLDPLVWDSALGGVALAHSQDMKDRAFFAHTNPDGDDPFDRMAAAGISYRSAGENIAVGQATGQTVFDTWIDSSGHRANIENSDYTHHGLEYVEDGNYWTHVFARNPSLESETSE